jgi:hypothetical protein
VANGAEEHSPQRSILLLRSNRRIEHSLARDGTAQDAGLRENLGSTAEPAAPLTSGVTRPPWVRPLLDPDYFAPAESDRFEQVGSAPDHSVSAFENSPIAVQPDPPSELGQPASDAALSAPNQPTAAASIVELESSEPPSQQARLEPALAPRAEPLEPTLQYPQNWIAVGPSTGLAVVGAMLLCLLVLLTIIVVLLMRLLPSQRDQVIRLQMDGMPPLFLTPASRESSGIPRAREPADNATAGGSLGRETSVVDLASEDFLLAGVHTTFRDLWKARQSELHEEEQAIIEGLTEENVTLAKRFAELKC